MTNAAYEVRLDNAAAEAMRETLPRVTGWWPFRQRTEFQPTFDERRKARNFAKAYLRRKRERGESFTKEQLAEHVRQAMHIKEGTKSAAWLIVFAARLLMLLAMFAEESTEGAGATP